MSAVAKIGVPWADWQIDQIGVKEIKGPRNNPTIMGWAEETGHKNYTNDDIAWCALFQDAAMEEAGLPYPKSLLARDYLKWGFDIGGPAPGATFVMPRNNSSWQAHVGTVLSVSSDGQTFKSISGNVSDQVKIVTYRTSTCFKNGFRWPTGVTLTPAAAAVYKKNKGKVYDSNLPNEYGSTGSDEIEPNTTVYLKEGMYGPLIEDMQADLDKLGYMNNDEESSYFGAETKDAVRAYQKDKNLDRDGIAGPATLGSIRKDIQNLKAKNEAESIVQKDSKDATKQNVIGAAGGIIATGSAAITAIGGTAENISWAGIVFVVVLLVAAAMGYIVYTRTKKDKVERIVQVIEDE